MKKVAIVGVEGAGKTVMLAGLGGLFSRPDANGYYFEPQDQETVRYIRTQCDKLRNGKWPSSTPPDVSYGLNWHLKKTCGDGVSETVAQISCLDFAGEVYRAAFGAPLPGKEIPDKDAARLKRRISSADEVVVLLNLRDVISGTDDTVRAGETEFVLLRMLQYVLEDLTGLKPRVLLALSQSDMYSETITVCGGPRQTLAKYLPTIMLRFGFLDVVAVHSVDRTVLDAKGEVVPAKGCSPAGLRPMVEWLLPPLGGESDWIRMVRGAIQRKSHKWRVIGLLASIAGAVGMAWIGFIVWLNNWDAEFDKHIRVHYPASAPAPESIWAKITDKISSWFASRSSASYSWSSVEDFDVSLFSGGWSWSLLFWFVFVTLTLVGLTLSSAVSREERSKLPWGERFRIPIATMVFLFVSLSTLSINVLCVPTEYYGLRRHSMFIDKYLSIFDSGWLCAVFVVLALVFAVIALVSIVDSYDRHIEEQKI